MGSAENPLFMRVFEFREGHYFKYREAKLMTPATLPKMQQHETYMLYLLRHITRCMKNMFWILKTKCVLYARLVTKITYT